MHNDTWELSKVWFVYLEQNASALGIQKNHYLDSKKVLGKEIMLIWVIYKV